MAAWIGSGTPAGRAGAESRAHFAVLLVAAGVVWIRGLVSNSWISSPSMAALVELFLGSTSATVDWEAEAYPTYGDFAVLPLLVAFFPAVRFLLDRLVFEVISCSLEVPWIRNARAKLRLGSWSVTDGM